MGRSSSSLSEDILGLSTEAVLTSLGFTLLLWHNILATFIIPLFKELLIADSSAPRLF